MKPYLKKDYRLNGFRKSNTINKKYDAILKHKKTKSIVHVPFGDKRYAQYKDRVHLQLYASKNHLDKERRKRYRKRHEAAYTKQEAKNIFSPAYFSWNYLW